MTNFKILLIASVLVFSIKLSHAQQFNESWDGTPNLERHQLTLNFLTPGFKYELGLFKNVSASTSFTPGFGYLEEGYAFGIVWNTRLRYYLNFDSRYQSQKNIKYNSADYLAVARSVFWEPLMISTDLDGIGEYSLAFWGFTYGSQRTNKNGFTYNVELGVGYFEGIGVGSGYGSLLNFSFGWVATNRKKNKEITFD